MGWNRPNNLILWSECLKWWLQDYGSFNLPSFPQRPARARRFEDVIITQPDWEPVGREATITGLLVRYKEICLLINHRNVHEWQVEMLCNSHTDGGSKSAKWLSVKSNMCLWLALDDMIHDRFLLIPDQVRLWQRKPLSALNKARVRLVADIYQMYLWKNECLMSHFKSIEYILTNWAGNRFILFCRCSGPTRRIWFIKQSIFLHGYVLWLLNIWRWHYTGCLWEPKTLTSFYTRVLVQLIIIVRVVFVIYLWLSIKPSKLVPMCAY